MKSPAARHSLHLLTGFGLAALAACSNPGNHTGGDDVGPDAPTPPPDDAPPPPPPDAPPPPPQTRQVCASGGQYTTIGAALAASNAGDTILACAGTYREHLVLDKAITLRGTAGWMQTTLDGGSLTTPITVRSAGEVTIDGFTLTHGTSFAEGGGLRCEASTLHVKDTTLIANLAGAGGGGLYATGCTLDINNVNFFQNRGGPSGGGALVVNSTGTIQRAAFEGNQATEGGGLATSEGTVGIVDSSFHDNTAEVHGGAIYHVSSGLIAGNMITANHSGWTGGGIHVVMHSPLIRDNAITGNVAVNDGGGLYLDQSSATLRANIITDNDSGDDGGGLHAFESSAIIDGNRVEHNHASANGGGIRVSHVPSTLTDNLIRNNAAGQSGGGLDLVNDASQVSGGEITGNTAAQDGGGIFGELGPWVGTVIDNVTISQNSAWRGGGMFFRDEYTPVTLRHLIVTANTAATSGGGLMISDSVYTLAGSLFAHNQAAAGGGLYHAVTVDPMLPPPPPGMPCSPCLPTAPSGHVGFVTFDANTGDGAAVYSETIGLTVADSILSNHADPAVKVATTLPDPTPVWTYNDIWPMTATGMSGMRDPTGIDGNLAVDPQFVDAITGNYHLRPQSACIDAGDPGLSDGDGSRADLGMFGGRP